MIKQDAIIASSSELTVNSDPEPRSSCLVLAYIVLDNL